jgi:RHS repeat-associated protein
MLSSSISYDGNGDLLNDTFHAYGWDSFVKLLTIDATTCGSNGTCLTYDALGRMVETNVSGTYTEVLYSPVGKTAIMSGQTTSSAYFPLPAGETLYETGSSGSTQYFWHKDWLGSARFASSLSGRSSYYDRAFAPFGETYSNYGNAGGSDFTGDTQDTISGTYDTPNRELNPTQGRWISPDPAGLGAVEFGNPQSWNRYAYVTNNPVSYTDPLGLVKPLCGSYGNLYCTSGDPTQGTTGLWMSDEFGLMGIPAGQPYWNDGWHSPNSGFDWFGGYFPSGPFEIGGTSWDAANNGQPQPQLTQCQQTVLNAVNSQFGTNAAVLPSSDPGVQPGGQVNVDFGVNSGLTPAQFNSIQPGRYAPSGFWGALTGYGPSLHVVAAPSGLDPNAMTFTNSNVGGAYSVSFTAHIDSAWADNPIGFLLHLFIDVFGSKSRKPCP